MTYRELQVCVWLAVMNAVMVVNRNKHLAVCAVLLVKALGELDVRECGGEASGRCDSMGIL